MPGPQPTPEPVPTPTPDVSHITLPAVPSNTYQLLSNFADAIDTANGHFTTHATQLGSISQDTNGAVNNVLSTSQGSAVTALSDTWKSTQTDFGYGQDALSAIVASNCLGGSPNPLRDALNQHQSDIQTGLLAMENIQALQRSSPLQPPSAQQVEMWIQEVNSLAGALGNVNLALEMMILALRGLNGGFAATCATGFVPGVPPPTFSQNAFAMSSSGGGGGSGGKMTLGELESNLKAKGVDAKTAEELALTADYTGINLDNVDLLINKGVKADTILAWINDGKITVANQNDIIALANRDVSGGALTRLITNGADLNNVTALLNGSYTGLDGAKVSQWIEKGLDPKYAKILLDRGASVSTIDRQIVNYLNPSTGGVGWRNALRNSASDIKSSFQRWSTGTNLGPNVGRGNDGQPFGNAAQWNSVDRRMEPPFPNPVGTVREYYIDPNGSTRILIDESGTAYYYPDHYDPGTRVKIPFSYIISILKK